MALKESNQIDIGSMCPNFELPSVDGKKYALSDFADKKGLVVAFWCNHCPYVQAIEDRFYGLAKEFGKKGIQFVTICSNDWKQAKYAGDAPAELLKKWRQKDFGFPYLVDETQEIAKAFDAMCTPDIYVYDGQQKLFYHGEIDDSWKIESQVTREKLKEALNDLLEGKAPPKDQKPTIGCNIKWR